MSVVWSLNFNEKSGKHKSALIKIHEKNMSVQRNKYNWVSYNNSLLTLIVGKSRIVVGVQFTWHTLSISTWPIKTTWVMRHVWGNEEAK